MTMTTAATAPAAFANDYGDPATVSEIFRTVAESRDLVSFVRHQEAQGYLYDLTERLYYLGRMTDGRENTVERLDLIYTGRLDETDHSDYWTQFVAGETADWLALLAAAAPPAG